MDTHEYDYWVQHTHLRSKRQKKRLRIESEDKMLIRKHKEEIDIWKQRRNAEWMELKPPVQRGFVRFFELRSDVARTKDSAFFLKILEKINTQQWSSRRDFKKKRRQYGKKIYVVREQSLADVGESDFRKKFSDSEKICFEETWVHYKHSKVPQRVYRFIESWRFVLKIQPYMITKLRVKDIELDKRSAELERFFTVKRRRRLNKVLDTHYRWGGYNKDPVANPLSSKSFASILSEHWPDTSRQIFLKNPRDIEGFFISVCYSALKLFTGFARAALTA